jgi:hypothetical protein
LLGGPSAETATLSSDELLASLSSRRRVDDALPAAAGLGVNRHFAARKVDPQAAIADNHLNALADQLPRHTVTVAVVARGFGAGARFAASARGQIDRPIQNCRLAMAGGARGWLSFPNAP